MACQRIRRAYPFRLKLFGFIGDRSLERKADCLALAVAGECQDDAGQGQDAGALRSRPAFAEAAIEGVGHHLHHPVEVVGIARTEDHWA